jgi:hypothetical protein
MFAFARAVAKLFTSWSDTTPSLLIEERTSHASPVGQNQFRAA